MTADDNYSKSPIKSPKNNYKQRVKSLFEQVWCAKLRFIN